MDYGRDDARRNDDGSDGKLSMIVRLEIVTMYNYFGGKKIKISRRAQCPI